jgi:hypothetical protein
VVEIAPSDARASPMNGEFGAFLGWPIRPARATAVLVFIAINQTK